MVFTRRLHLVMERVMPKTSVSWKASEPMSGPRTWPVRQTSGTESILASAMPVTRLVAPGPLVAMATPTLPVTRAYPSAANTAPCSCRVRMWRTPLPSSASYSGMIAPPGYPNTRSTPSARRQRRTTSAPLAIHNLPPGSLCRLRFLALFGQPRHHVAQLGADFFDGMKLLDLAQCAEVPAARLVLRDPFPGERSILNARQCLFHRHTRRVAHHLVAAREIAIFRGV